MKGAKSMKRIVMMNTSQGRRQGRLAATIAAGIILVAPSMVLAHTRKSTIPVQTGYAQVNGLNLYYEVRGRGEPLILLHGGLTSTEVLGEVLASLARTRRVIAPDLQAHGRTADINRPLSAEAMSDDIAGLMQYLRILKADVMGYSLGGAVALQTAIRHPELVRKLVVVSEPCKQDGWYPEVRNAMAQIGPALAEPMKQTPIYQVYSHSAPRPQDWPTLLAKLGDLLRKKYDWTKEVASIEAPTMLVFADADAVRPEHVIEFFQLLGGGKRDGGVDRSGISNARLAILPGLTHYDIFSSPSLVPTVTQFLDGPMSKNE
jgi:pimeloyl-ACP methyl ester carboxylesterase